METVKTALIPDKLLETPYSGEVIASLEDALTRGLAHVLVELQPSERSLRPADLVYYDDEDEATDDWELKTTGGYLPGGSDHPVYCRRTERLLCDVRLANMTMPEHLIAGVLFVYHAEQDVFLEKGKPFNQIPMTKIWEDQLWSQFFFDHQTKNVYQGGFPNGEPPAHVQLVILPTIPYCDKLGINIKTHQEKQGGSKQAAKRAHPIGKPEKTKLKKGRKVQ
ncbi:hypothetical protein DJ568_02955 [Mucilaginibacter hurinus]|uniref:Uncharacterized protein n=1 Tax=Mucilaginibacter hurinus TaxID=2201324 RepID=A0A367GU47_9SPHI|nr:hypothetical protein [Mucilaginibacter hurinus]RCH56830.1 hypothetical protein DJ568_02955 [Mucilaginibacter hurinus]